MCSLAALAILLIRKILGKKAGAWWRSVIWMVLLVRLCIPFNLNSSIGVLKSGMFESGVSMEAALQANEPDPAVYSVLKEDAAISNDDTAAYEQAQPEEAPVILENNISVSEIITPPQVPVSRYAAINDRPDSAKQKTGWLQIAYIVYTCGFAAALIFLCFRAIALSISLKKLEKCSDSAILKNFARIKTQLGIKKDIEILIDKNKSVPALAGVFKTKLILPEKAASRMSEQEMEYVFIHELTHYKRKDILKLWFAEFALCLHWFNPILHYVKSIMRQDIELSCDEKIISRLKDTAFIKYCNVLMMSSIKRYKPVPGIITVNMAGRRGKKLKERLTMINNFSRKRIILLGAVLLIAASLILVSCTTFSRTDDTTDLGLTPDKMNENVAYLMETFGLSQYNSDFVSEESISNSWGTETLSYPLIADSQGNTVFSLNYIMSKGNDNIKEIILKKEKKNYDLTLFNYPNTKIVIDISLMMDIYGVSNIGFLDYNNYRYLGSESFFSLEMIKAEEDESSYKISPYSKKEIEQLNNGLNITAQLIDEKIGYLLDNDWLDTKLEFHPEDAYSSLENGKTVIKYPITPDENGNAIITLEYTLAPDGKNIETIAAKNYDFFSRELYQQAYIDINLIAGKAYLLAAQDKENLDYKIAADDKPIYMNDLKYTEMSETENLYGASILDSSNNLYVSVIKSSRNPLAALTPVYESFEQYHPGIVDYNIGSDDVMRQVSNLVDENYIDTALDLAAQSTGSPSSSTGEDGVSIASAPYSIRYTLTHHLEEITEYPVLTDENGVQILSAYFVTDTYARYGTEINKGNISGYIRNIYVVYKKYLGDDDTDKLYKDLCILLDAAVIGINDDTGALPEITASDYASASAADWDMDGKLKITYAPDHETLFAAFDDTYNIPLWDNLPYNTDERHPHLGVTVNDMNEKLILLSENNPDYSEIDLDISAVTQELELGRHYATYPLKTTDDGKALLFYSFVLHSDGAHITGINVQLIKDRLGDENKTDMENKYRILRDMVDTAFVMARENVDSYEDISPDNYPFPEYENQDNPRELPVVKIFDGQAYLLEAQDEISYEQQIITASPLFELLYFK
jgi:beta-lactamase regulating signal transducer with metallopeptidase domain